MPKQNAATEDSGTKAPTASPGCSPIASMVERPAYRIDVLGLHDALGPAGRAGRHRDGGATVPAFDLADRSAGGGQGPAVEGSAPVREGLVRHRPLLEHVGGREHGVGPDVLHRELELGGERRGSLNTATIPPRRPTATAAARVRQVLSACTRTVGEPPRAVVEEGGELARGLHDLADRVRAERVDDRHLVRRTVGTLGELLGKNLHVLSSCDQC